MSDMPSNELAALIDTVEASNGWTDPDIAQRATIAGHKMSKSLVSLIRTGGTKTIVPSQMRALAAGLDLPLHRVVRAALATFDLELPGSEFLTPEDAIRADESLDLSTKRTLLVVLSEARSAPQLKVARRRK